MEDFFGDEDGIITSRNAQGQVDLISNAGGTINVEADATPLSTARVRVIRSPQINDSERVAPSLQAAPDTQTTAPQANPVASAVQGQTAEMKAQSAEAKNARLALSGAKFFADVMNANLAYNQQVGASRLNVFQVRNQMSDAVFRGSQNAMRAESEGRAAAEDATVRLAAQGQDVSGAAVQRVQDSYNLVAQQNAMQERMNALREVYGLELEETRERYNLANARNVRDASMIGSALNFGASAWSSR